MRVQFTDRFVANTKATDARVEHFDSKVSGLSLRVSRSGVKAWSLHYTASDGRRARVGLGAYPAMSLAAARSAALEALGSLQSGTDPRTRHASRMSVAELIEAYLAKHVQPNLRTAEAIERRMRVNVIPLIGGVPFAELHRRDVNRVIDRLIARDAPAEANLTYAYVRGCIRWAVARGDLDHDPIAGMKPPAQPQARDRVLSDHEVQHLWSMLPDALGNADGAKDAERILKLCLVTAQRIGEVAGLRRSELDLPARLWRLPAARSKNKAAHTIPLTDMAISIIEEAIADAGDRDELFGITPKRAGRFVMERQKAFGLAHWRPHDLRRTALTGMARLGVAPIVLGHVANHRTTTRATITLSVYIAHSYESEKRQGLDLWADRLAAIISGEVAAKVIPLGARQ
jgi:integrase